MNANIEAESSFERSIRNIENENTSNISKNYSSTYNF